MMMMIFKDGILSKVRHVANLSQIELAKAIGVSQVTISKLETGIIPITSDRERQLIKVFNDAGLKTADIKLLASVLGASNL